MCRIGGLPTTVTTKEITGTNQNNNQTTKTNETVNKEVQGAIDTNDKDETVKVEPTNVPAKVEQATFPTKSATAAEIDNVKAQIASKSDIHGVNASELGKLIRAMKKSGMDESAILEEMKNLLSASNDKGSMSEAIIAIAGDVGCKFHPDTIKEPFCFDATLSPDEAMQKQNSNDITAAEQGTKLKKENRKTVEDNLVVDKNGMVDVGKTLVKLNGFKFNFNINAGAGKTGEAQTTTDGKPKPVGFVDIFNELGVKLGVGLSIEKFSASKEVKMNKEMFMKLLDNMGEAKTMDEAVKLLESFVKLANPDFFEKIKTGSGTGEKQ